MANYSDTEEEARRRATRAMLDNVYKQTADSRGEMMRASRRAFTDSPERGMSPDGEAAAADARAMAGDLVRGTSAPARARLGVAAPAMGKGPSGTRAERGRQASADARSKRPRPPVMAAMPVPRDEVEPIEIVGDPNRQAAFDAMAQGLGRMDQAEYDALRRAAGRQRMPDGMGARLDAAARAGGQALAGGPSRKSGGDAYIQAQETAANMAAQREQARRERAMADVDERRDAGLFSDEGYRRAIEAMRDGQNVDSTRADLKARHEAGLLSDLEYMRAVESLNR